jgi:FMN phosphatase YigB (HAD superfamily)
MSEKRKCAFFDIDGTIYRYALFPAVVERLIEHRKLSAHATDHYDAALKSWKDRNDSEAFSEFTRSFVELFEQSLDTLKVSEVTATIPMSIVETL